MSVEIDKAGWVQARGVCLKDPDDARFGPADLLTHFPGCVCFATGDARCGGQSTLSERLKYQIRRSVAKSDLPLLE